MTEQTEVNELESIMEACSTLRPEDTVGRGGSVRHCPKCDTVGSMVYGQTENECLFCHLVIKK